MKLRFVVLVSVALCSFAKEPHWARQPGTPVTFEASGFELRTTLPHGWTFTTAEGFAPPPGLASSCSVRVELQTDRNWDRFLVSRLRATHGARTTVLKMGGHPAVSNRYERDHLRVEDLYINLAELQPDSSVVWRFEGSPTPEGSDCELQFLTIVNRAAIARH